MVFSSLVIGAVTLAAAIRRNIQRNDPTDPTIETTLDQSEIQKEIEALVKEEFQSLFTDELRKEIHSILQEEVKRQFDDFQEKNSEKRDLENFKWRERYKKFSKQEREEFWQEKDNLCDFYGNRWKKKQEEKACDPGDPTIETTLDQLEPGEGKEMIILTPSGTWKNGIHFHNKKADEAMKEAKAAV